MSLSSLRYLDHQHWRRRSPRFPNREHRPYRRRTSGRLESQRRREFQAIAATNSCRSTASCKRQGKFTLFGEPCGVAEGLENVLPFEVGVIGEELVDCVT